MRYPESINREIHQNRLLKLAREGGQMTAQHLRDLESARRYPTLVAVVLEARATVIDEIGHKRGSGPFIRVTPQISACIHRSYSRGSIWDLIL